MTAYPLESIGGHHGDSWIRAMLDGPGALRLLLADRPRRRPRELRRDRLPLALLVGGARPRPPASGAVGHSAIRRSSLALRHPREGRLDRHAGPRAARPRPAPRQRDPGRDRPDRPAPGAPRDVARLLGRGRPHPGRCGGLLALGPVGRPRRSGGERAGQRSRGALHRRRGLGEPRRLVPVRPSHRHGRRTLGHAGAGLGRGGHGGANALLGGRPLRRDARLGRARRARRPSST